MKHLVVTAFCAIVLSTTSSTVAADATPKVLRQFSLEGGYQYTTRTTFTHVGKQGGSALLSMGWRLTKLAGPGPATYLTIPLGYYGIPTFGDTARNYASVMFYGWTIRHELACVKKFTPFLEYGLLLNQLFVSSVAGRSIAHQTRLAGGTDVVLSPDWSLLLKLEYGMSSYPTLGERKSQKINTFALVTGLRWGGRPETR